MRRTIACVFAASFLLIASAAARTHTGKLSGTIITTNGRPAVRAQVMIECSDGSRPLATHTDSQGRFLFQFVPHGLYDIRASDRTAASVWKHNLLVHSGKETIVNLRLERIKPSPKATPAH